LIKYRTGVGHVPLVLRHLEFRHLRSHGAWDPFLYFCVVCTQGSNYASPVGVAGTLNIFRKSGIPETSNSFLHTCLPVLGTKL
jgi:hypothetical protein